MLCKTGSQQACATANTPMRIWTSYRYVVMQHQRTAALSKIAPLLFSAALQNRLTAGTVSLQLHLWRFALHTGVCSDATPMLCSTGQIASLLFSAAVQIRLTACLCHCKYTYGDLDFIPVCSDATPMHCSTGQNSFPAVQWCSAKQAHSMLVPLHLQLWRFGLHTSVQ